MARPSPLQRSFDRGMRRDFARGALPAGALWNAVDVLPNLDAPLRERGGYTYASDDIAATKATASRVEGGIYAPFSAAAQNLAVDEDGELYTIAAGGGVTDRGLAVQVAQNPVFHRDKVILAAAGGATAPKKFDGSTIAALGGSPPNAAYATVFKDRTILAFTTGNRNRIWFSGAGNPDSWDTTNSYWDFTYPLTGLAALQGAILLFHEAHFSKLRGSIPPTVAGGTGDFVAYDPLFDVGCTDARSIVYYGDQVVFANPGGAYITDGVAYDDLTRLCGMKSYWRELAIQPGWTLAAGLLQDHYVIAIMNGGTFVDAAMIDLRRLAWWRLSNIDAIAFWRSVAASEELYFGRRGAARVGKLSPIFAPAASNKNDADGDPVASLVETPFYRGREGEKGWRHLYVTYDLDDYGTDDPTITVSYVKTPEATAYTAIASALAETSAEDRKRRQLGFAADGIALKLARANAGDFRLTALEADVAGREGSR